MEGYSYGKGNDEDHVNPCQDPPSPVGNHFLWYSNLRIRAGMVGVNVVLCNTGIQTVLSGLVRNCRRAPACRKSAANGSNPAACGYDGELATKTLQDGYLNREP